MKNHVQHECHFQFDEEIMWLADAHPANAQHCGNVMTMLGFVRLDTTLLQHCHDVEDEQYITTLWQLCPNIGIML